MKHRRLAAIALVALAFGVAPSQAADFPRPLAAPSPAGLDWSGAYIGVHMGYARDRGTTTSQSETADNSSIFLLPGQGDAYASSSRSQSRFGGMLGGLQAGYNIHAGQFVGGVEADVTFGGLSKASARQTDSAVRGNISAYLASAMNSVQVPFGAPPLAAGDYVELSERRAIVASHQIGTFATLRGRLGFAFDRYLVYVTGGLAIAELRTNASFSRQTSSTPNVGTYAGVFPSGSSSASISRLSLGGVAGAGIEARITQNWSVKAEYLYIALPAQTLTLYNEAETFRFDSRFHFGRVGANYRF